MHSGLIPSGIILCLVVTAACIQLPGFQVPDNTSDPIVSHWIGGELPLTDRHIIFYENRTFYSVNFYLNSGETIESGTWVKNKSGTYVTRSSTNESAIWIYDSSTDTIYLNNLPQMRFNRYKK